MSTNIGAALDAQNSADIKTALEATETKADANEQAIALKASSSSVTAIETSRRTDSVIEPGLRPDAYASNEAGDEITSDHVVTASGTYGRCIELRNGAELWTAAAPLLRPGVVDRVDFVVSRPADVADPNGENIQFGLNWYNAAGVKIGNSVVFETFAPFVSSGLISRKFFLSDGTAGAEGVIIDAEAPSGAVMYKLFAVPLGTDGRTQVYIHGATEAPGTASLSSTYSNEVGTADGFGTLFSRTRLIETNASIGRHPGLTPLLYTTSVSGNPDTHAPLPIATPGSGISVVTDAIDGPVVRVSNVQTNIALTLPFRISSNSYNKVLYQYRRINDSSDPARTAVFRGIRWLDETFTELVDSSDGSSDTTLTVADGLRSHKIIVGADGQIADIVPPAGAVWGVAYLTFLRPNGFSHATDAVTLSVEPHVGADAVLQNTFTSEVGVADDEGTLFARMRAAEVKRGQTQTSPALYPQAFTTTVSGDPDESSPLSFSSSNVNAIVASYGPAVRYSGVQSVAARRVPTRIEDGVIYTVTAEYARVVDPADPAASSVALAVRWQDEENIQLPSGAIYSEADVGCTVAAGVRRRFFTIGRAAVNGVVPDVIPPTDAVHFVEYLQLIGTDHTTDWISLSATASVPLLSRERREITVTNGRILIAGDSLSAFHYGPEHKAWVQWLSALTSYQVQNTSRSGDDTLELLKRLQDDINDYDSGTGIAFNDMFPEYVIIPLGANDFFTRLTSPQRFIENFRRLITNVKAIGATPIIMSEGRKFEGITHAFLSRLAEEENVRYWDISSYYFTQDSTRDADDHGNNHPGAQMTHIWKDAALQHIPSLGKPSSSIKAFRPRYRREICGPHNLYSFAGGVTTSQPNESYAGSLAGTARLIEDAELGWVYEGLAAGDHMNLGGGYQIPASYTISAFIKPTAFSGSQNILTGAGAGRIITLLNGSNLQVFHNSTAYITVAYGKPANEWHHIAVSYNASTGELKVYVDGAEVASASAVPNHASVNNDLGASAGGSSFLGRIGRVHIHDRVLDIKQIAQLAGDRNSLRFDNYVERMAHWRELRVGHHALTEDKEPYWDNLDGLSYEWSPRGSELLVWQNGETLPFVDKAMIEFVLPANRTNTDTLTLDIPGADQNAAIYIYNRQRALEGDTYEKRVIFVLAAKPNANDGNTYTFNSIAYTVVGLFESEEVDGQWWLAMDTVSDPTGGNLGSGTLIRQVGTGDATIAFLSTFAYNHEDVLQELYSPHGGWVNVAHSEGRMSFTKAALEGLLNTDTLTILVEKRGQFNLSAPSAVWTGRPIKDFYLAPGQKYERIEAELLNDTDVASIGGTDWEANAGSVTDIAPPDGVLPHDRTRCVVVDKDNRLEQALTITPDALVPRKLLVRVSARFATPKFTPSVSDSGGVNTVAKQEYAQKSPLTSDTVDHVRLMVGISNGDDRFVALAQDIVGPAPKDVLIPFEIPNARIWEDDSCKLIIWAESLYDGESAEAQIFGASVGFVV